MARTSKTKIGDSGESNDRMMRAASSGAAAVQQAHSELINSYQSGAQQANQNAQVANQVVGQGVERNQQQQQFERTAQQRDEATNLEAAKAGFEKEPASDRQSRLESEMRQGAGQPQIGPLQPEDQQRLSDQASKKMEMEPSGRWRPTAEHAAEKEREQKREDFKADTERMRAISYRDQVGVSAQKALAAGDKAAYDEHTKELAATPNKMQKRYDKLMKGDVNSNDWSELTDMARGGPDSDPTLMADLKANSFTPRVAAFVRAQVQKDALTSVVLSKGSTKHLDIDWTAPKMREFTTQVANLNDFMRSNPALGQLAFIKDTGDKMRFLNVMAASQVLLGMTQAPSPSGGMMPATAPGGGGGAPPGSPEMGPPAGSTQVPGRAAGAAAVQNARAGGASPSDALRAGQQANPTGNEPVDTSQLRFNN